MRYFGLENTATIKGKAPCLSRKDNRGVLFFDKGKKIIAGFFIICFTFVPPVFSAKSQEGVDFIFTTNYANTRLEYYYYIPSEIRENNQRAYPLLICVPGLSGRGEQFVNDKFKRFAEEEGFIIVAPSFMWDEKNWNSRTSYQFPEFWSGQALLEIIDNLSKTQNLTISELYLYGVSAGAQFALRFALWSPHFCIACAAHAAGGTVIPKEKSGVKFYVTVGRKDDEIRNNRATTFYKTARELGIDATYKQYDCGHELPVEQVEDSLIFFKRVKDSRPITDNSVLNKYIDSIMPMNEESAMILFEKNIIGKNISDSKKMVCNILKYGGHIICDAEVLDFYSKKDNAPEEGFFCFGRFISANFEKACLSKRRKQNLDINNIPIPGLIRLREKQETEALRNFIKDNVKKCLYYYVFKEGLVDANVYVEETPVGKLFYYVEGFMYE